MADLTRPALVHHSETRFYAPASAFQVCPAFEIATAQQNCCTAAELFSLDEMWALMRRFRCTVFGIFGAVALYVIAFVWRFDVLSDPVRNNQYGWLGPQVRGDKHCVDVGKVLYYDSDDVTPYKGVFQPLCKTWIWLDGF